MSELKPCPYCGGTNIRPAALSAGKWYFCWDCEGASGGLTNGIDGIEGWNHRPIEDRLQEEIETLRTRLHAREAPQNQNLSDYSAAFINAALRMHEETIRELRHEIERLRVHAHTALELYFAEDTTGALVLQDEIDAMTKLREVVKWKE